MYIAAISSAQAFAEAYRSTSKPFSAAGALGSLCIGELTSPGSPRFPLLEQRDRIIPSQFPINVFDEPFTTPSLSYKLCPCKVCYTPLARISTYTTTSNTAYIGA